VGISGYRWEADSKEPFDGKEEITGRRGPARDEERNWQRRPVSRGT